MKNKYQIIEEAIEKYGESAQIVVAIEELSELQKELCKWLREEGDVDQITEEMADVQIVMEELELIFGNEEGIKEETISKLSRLDERMKHCKRVPFM